MFTGLVLNKFQSVEINNLQNIDWHLNSIFRYKAKEFPEMPKPTAKNPKRNLNIISLISFTFYFLNGSLTSMQKLSAPNCWRNSCWRQSNIKLIWWWSHSRVLRTSAKIASALLDFSFASSSHHTRARDVIKPCLQNKKFNGKRKRRERNLAQPESDCECVRSCEISTSGKLWSGQEQKEKVTRKCSTCRVIQKVETLFTIRELKTQTRAPSNFAFSHFHISVESEAVAPIGLWICLFRML